jgi:hypothetical protein
MVLGGNSPVTERLAKPANKKYRFESVTTSNIQDQELTKHGSLNNL